MKKEGSRTSSVAQVTVLETQFFFFNKNYMKI